MGTVEGRTYFQIRVKMGAVEDRDYLRQRLSRQELFMMKASKIRFSQDRKC